MKFRCFLLSTFLFFGFNLSAFDFQTGGIYYNILSEEEDQCEVTNGTSDYSGSVTIPSSASYNGKIYSVVKIGDNAFSFDSDLILVTLPSSVTAIGKSAF